jgi:hypothetical protein
VRALALSLALVASGCTQATDLLPADGGDGGFGDGGCDNPGPPIVLGQAPCSGALAAHNLRYAVCSCAPLVLTHGLYTEGGMPMPGPGPGMQPPAAVGTDGDLQIAGPVQVAGTLEAAGVSGASFSRTSTVLGSLRSGGSIGSNQFLSIGQDGFAGGDVLGRIDVNGFLHLPPGAFIGPSVSLGGVVREDVKVQPPCGCDAGPVIDVGAEVAARATSNGDGRVFLAPDAFADGTGALALDLPCGEYYLTALRTPAGAELTLRVHGRVGLFVGGDVTLSNGLHVVLDPSSELDLVVAGNFTAAAGLVGAPQASLVRLWLGSSTVHLGADASFSALVYAPSAVVLSDSDLVGKGALFAQSLSVAGDVAIHFDSMLFSAGAVCGAPPERPVE